jgi:uncharacterized protein (TIGR04255 family)
MAQERHLSRAPITEALIELKIRPSSHQDLSGLRSFHERVHDYYPHVKDQTEYQFHFRAGASHEQRTLATPVGYRISSDDGKRVIQVTSRGFTFSWLKPYETWEALHDEAHRLWIIYEELVQPELVTRVATRYINQIDLPMRPGDFEEYFTVSPQIPSSLPQSIYGFFSRIIISDEQKELYSTVIQSCDPVGVQNLISVILDIDAYKAYEFSQSSDAWSTLDRLRRFKNRIFFESLTETAVRMYE